MKILDQVRNHMRTVHMAIRTERAYVNWIKRFLQYERRLAGEWRHPDQMGSDEVNRFLTHLAVDGKVAASTQNQALSALLLLFREVLQNEKLVLDAVRAKHPEQLPVVLSVPEVWRVMGHIPFGVIRLICGLQYGSGLRLLESCRLRLKDVDFDRRQIIVRDAKGQKDRAVPLPQKLVAGLRRQLESVRIQHADDLNHGAGWVWLPYALNAKYPNAGREIDWQYVFPGRSLSRDPRRNTAGVGSLKGLGRHHVHESTIQKSVKRAMEKAGVTKHASCHSFRV